MRARKRENFKFREPTPESADSGELPVSVSTKAGYLRDREARGTEGEEDKGQKKEQEN